MNKGNLQVHTRESGFALLIALIVVGVVLSVGLTILDVSIKQVRLSTNAKESEIAFHAANAGMECARYIRRDQSADMEIGQDITPSCFNGTVYNNTHNSPVSTNPADGGVYGYQYRITWGESGAQRCTEVYTLIISTEGDGGGITVAGGDLIGEIPGYPASGGDKDCEAGAQCTIISVQGYNRPCSNVTSYGTVQREVLLQF